MQDDLEDALAAAGSRLRALRRQRETTLAELSAATGISVSTLSRLESDARKPTLELLLPLARAHGVTLDELVGAPPTGDPRIHLRPVTRNGMTMLPLTRRAGGIQAYKLVIPAESRTSPVGERTTLISQRVARRQPRSSSRPATAVPSQAASTSRAARGRSSGGSRRTVGSADSASPIQRPVATASSAAATAASVERAPVATRSTEYASQTGGR